MLGSLFQPTGYLSIFLLIASTGCGMPIPEEVFIVAAGVLSASGQLDITAAFIACLAGAIVGDSCMYFIGRKWGHRIFTKHPRFAKLFADENEEQVQRAIHDHALKVMLLARFLVGVRAPVYIMTGVVRMKYRKFLLFDAISAALVVSTVFSLAYVFGRNVQEWVHHAEFTATLIVVLVFAIVGGYLYYRHRQSILDFVFGSDTPPAEHQPSPPSQENPS